MKGLEQKHREEKGKKENNESRTGSRYFRCLKKESQEKVGRGTEEDGHTHTHTTYLFIHFLAGHSIYSA